MVYVIEDISGKPLLKDIMKKSYKRQIKQSLELKKELNKKSDKLYVKCKDYGSSFNCWIDKKI